MILAMTHLTLTMEEFSNGWDILNVVVSNDRISFGYYYHISDKLKYQ